MTRKEAAKLANELAKEPTDSLGRLNDTFIPYGRRFGRGGPRSAFKVSHRSGTVRDGIWDDDFCDWRPI